MTLWVLCISITITLFIGGYTFWHDRRSATNILFFLLTLSSVAWSITNYLSVNQIGVEATLRMARWETFFAVIYSLCAFLNIYNYPSRKLLLKPYKLIILLAFSSVVLALTQTSLMFSSLQIVGSSYIITPGPAIAPFALLHIFLIFGSIYLLIKRIRRTKRGEKHDQLVFLLVGVIVSNFTIFITNFIFVNFLKYSELLKIGPYFGLLFILIISYAIFTRHMFDIRLFIRRTVVFTLLLGFMFAAYGAIVFTGAQLFQSQDGLTTRTFAANLISAILIGFSIDPLRRFLEDKTDRFLFRKEYEQQDILKDLSGHLTNVVSLDEALETVMQTSVKYLHLHHAVTYVFQPGENNTLGITRIKHIGYSRTAKLMLEEHDLVMQFFMDNLNIVLTKQLEHELEHGKTQLKRKDSKLHHQDNQTQTEFIRTQAVMHTAVKKLNSLEAAVAIPLHIGQQLIGLILLSDKLGQESFSSADLTLLDLIGSQTIAAIQKAKLYEGDQMKTEFVSIASHELLTPISAIEGYLSMILDEHIGHVDPQAHEYLDKVYSSARRLSILIKDLLSVSRIESGKMKVVLQSLDMSKMVHDTMDQLKFVAKDKKLKLLFDEPKEPLPSAWADPDRVTQVLVNLVGNAIKYTPKGSVTISLSLDADRGHIITEISDTGLGMTKEQQSHLFEKFYRVASQETAGIMGTGLGLYITRSLVEKMGGTISVKSQAGKGSVFTFSLPVFQVETSTIS